MRTKLTFYLLGVGWRVGGVGVKHKGIMWLVFTCDLCVWGLYMNLFLHTITYITLLCCGEVYVFHPCTVLQVPATKRRVMRVSGRSTTWSAEPASVLPAPSHHLQLRQISSL